jgi:hypothetical protein
MAMEIHNAHNITPVRYHMSIIIVAMASVTQVSAHIQRSTVSLSDSNVGSGSKTTPESEPYDGRLARKR